MPCGWALYGRYGLTVPINPENIMKLFVITTAAGKWICTTLAQAKKFVTKMHGKGIAKWHTVKGRHLFITEYVPNVCGKETLATVESVQCI